MNKKLIKRILALLYAVLLTVTSFPDSVYASAATVPTVEVTGEFSYLIRLLYSSFGITVSKSAVPVLWGAIDAQARADDPDFLQKAQAEIDGFSDRFGLDFCNALQKKIYNQVSGATIAENEHGGGSMDFAVSDSTSFLIDGPVCVEAVNNATSYIYMFSFLHTVSDSLFYNYDILLAKDKNPSCLFVRGGFLYVMYSDGGYDLLMSAYAKNGVPRNSLSAIQFKSSINQLLCDIFEIPMYADLDSALEFFNTGSLFGLQYSPRTIDVSVALDKILAEINSQAMANSMKITAPIVIPSDVAIRDEQLASVGSVSDFDTLIKALAGAGVAIDVGSIPQETEKPTEGEKPGEEAESISKQLNAIYEAIIGIADKIGAIPSQIEGFFSVDEVAVSGAVSTLENAFKSRFDALFKIPQMFLNLSVKLDSTIPIITMNVPNTLHEIYGGDSVIVFDLREYADCFLQALFGQSCKTFLDIVACPNWTKLQSLGQPCFG